MRSATPMVPAPSSLIPPGTPPPRGDYKVYEDAKGQQWYAIHGEPAVERKPVYLDGKAVYEEGKLKTTNVGNRAVQGCPRPLSETPAPPEKPSPSPRGRRAGGDTPCRNPTSSNFGDGGDQWGEAARNVVNAAKELGKEGVKLAASGTAAGVANSSPLPW